jgi:predicted transcriptional regulator
MRTTITIDDGLLEDAKRRAEELDMTLSAMIEDALRERLARPAVTRKPKFKLITFGGDGLQTGLSWDEVGRIIDGDEDERLSSLNRDA